MTKNNAREYMPAVEALADGELQVQTSDGKWKDVEGDVRFTEAPSSYRRRPKLLVLYAVYYNITGDLLAVERNFDFIHATYKRNKDYTIRKFVEDITYQDTEEQARKDML